MVCLEAIILVSLVLKMTFYIDYNLEKHNIAENNFSLKFPSQQDKFTLVWLHLLPSHSSFSVQQVSLWLI